MTIRNAETIFHEARRKATPSERAAYLDGACAGDLALRAKVETLLRADAEAGSFMASVEPRAGDAATVASPREKPGQTIGRYKLLQVIGEGGFGEVWMAEQREPVKRRVAVKVIKLGMDTRQVIARFEAERQALAMMDHPNIARVLDAGATDNGRPYFVMELVKGVPITEYCDTENLTTDERLGLFISVCQAAQHAHQKGIIHRDIKPSNVLITLHDDKPVVKVIDFGIAKAINRELTDKTLFTEFRQFVGTPEYMSPEQAEMSGLDIDTRSDIYSLGVLLYELLTGVTPFDARKLRSAALAEIQRIIREQEPPRPSTRLSEVSAVAQDDKDKADNDERSSIQYITRHRRTDLRSLTRTLRGDLDWIVMKALEKDRSRRYETANGFAMDVQRYLKDEPVVASPPSAPYKLRKLIKRNKGAFAAAALVFLILTLGVIGTSWGLVSANAQASRAEHELARANEVKRLITEMFKSVSPEVAQGQDITLLKQILDDTAERLDAGEITDELIAAELHQLIGDVYRRLGLYAPAEVHLSRALDIRKRVLGSEHPETLRCIHHLGWVYIETGRYADAEPLLQQNVEVSKRVLGKEHSETVDFMNDLAALYWHQGRLAEAERLWLEVLSWRERILGEEHEATLGCKQNLALLYFSQGRAAESEALYVEALEGHKRVLGAEHPVTLKTMTNLGFLYLQMEQYADALVMFETSVPIKRRVLGNRHPQTVLAIQGLSVTYMRLNRREDAFPLHEEQHDLRLEQAEESWATAEALNSVAWHQLTCSYTELRDPQTALRLAKRACNLEQANGGQNLWMYFDTLALAQHQTGDTAAAVETQKRAISLMPEGADPEMAERMAEYEAALAGGAESEISGEDE